MSDEWSTPQKLFNKLNDEFHFTLDACATWENKKVVPYFTREMNGLTQLWEGQVWCNPPYGRGIERWMHKAWESAALNRATVVMLIPARTNAPWWHEYVMRAHEIRFIRKKVSFGGPVKGVPFFGSVIVVFRPYRHRGSPTCVSYSRD